MEQQNSIEKQSVISLRPYQRKVVDKVLSIYRNNPNDARAFMEMFTGTGKTRSAFAVIIELFQSKKATIVWVAHEIQLVNQAYIEFQNDVLGNDDPCMDAMEVSYEGITIKFMTWQSYRTKKTVVDMLIVDECHRGSSDNRGLNEHKSFKAILKLSKTHLYVSATPWDLNPELFKGLFFERIENKKTKHSIDPNRVAVYSADQAREDDMICNVEFQVVSTADTLEIKRLESPEELTLENASMEDGVDFFKENKVNIRHGKSVEALNTSALYSMVDVYFQKETKNGRLPPTIVFCGNRTDPAFNVKNVIREFRKAASRHLPTKSSTGRAFIDYVNSDVNDASQKLLDFKAGKINILCVVGMAREGFNYRELEVAIDFVPSFNNARLPVQKVGRITRTADGKQQARYYHIDSFKNRINVKGVWKEAGPDLNQTIRNALSASTGRTNHTEDEVATTAAAVMAVTCLKKDVSGEEDTSVTVAGQEQYTQNGLSKVKGLPKTTITVTRIGFIVSNADNKDPVRTIRSSTLFVGLRTPDGVRDLEKKRMNIFKWFEDHNGERPRQLKGERSGNELNEQKLANFLGKAMAVNGPQFDPSLIDELERKYPGWSNPVQSNRNRWLQMARSGLPKPSYNSRDGKLINQYLSPSSNLFCPKFKKELIECRPDWRYSKLESSYLKMLSRMPEGVTFLPGQKWKGMKIAHKFYSTKHGNFKRIPAVLIDRDWKNKRSGHPVENRAKQKSCAVKVKCIETETIYESGGLAAKSVNRSRAAISIAATKGTTCAGYRWAYVD